MPRHGVKVSKHSQCQPLWEVCVLQTSFTAQGRIDYFAVHSADGRPEDTISPPTQPRQEANGATIERPLHYIGLPPLRAEEGFFEGLRGDLYQATRDLADKASVVDGVGHLRADQKKWLGHMGFAAYLNGLQDAEIWSSFKLPKRETRLTVIRRPTRVGEVALDTGDDQGNQVAEARDLLRILDAAEALFSRGYSQGAGKKGQDTAFRCFKNPSSLADYQRIMKQLLVYYHRVVFCDKGHFTRPQQDGEVEEGVRKNDRAVPWDIIEPRQEQQQAMKDMFKALRAEEQATRASEAQSTADQIPISGSHDHGTDHCDSMLICAVRRFYVGLICHEVGGVPLRSPVISFCAMLSRKKLFSRSSKGRKQLKGKPGG